MCSRGQESLEHVLLSQPTVYMIREVDEYADYWTAIAVMLLITSSTTVTAWIGDSAHPPPPPPHTHTQIYAWDHVCQTGTLT